METFTRVRCHLGIQCIRPVDKPASDDHQRQKRRLYEGRPSPTGEAIRDKECSEDNRSGSRIGKNLAKDCRGGRCCSNNGVTNCGNASVKLPVKKLFTRLGLRIKLEDCGLMPRAFSAS